MNNYIVTAEQYTKKDKVHYVKVEIDGLYISGIRVQKSIKYDNRLWIQMPKYKAGKEWRAYVESENDSALGAAIYDAITELMDPVVFPESAGKATRQNRSRVADDTPVDLSDIPF